MHDAIEGGPPSPIRALLVVLGRSIDTHSDVDAAFRKEVRPCLINEGGVCLYAVHNVVDCMITEEGLMFIVVPS
ncbi:MAG: hypothetical protein WCF33_08740 [Pseudonocardiaceae bacterium]